MTGPRPGWRGGVRAAGRAVAERPGLWLLALLGFLVRGGLVLLLLPILVLPSPIGAASVVGLRAVTIAAQPTPWLVGVLAVGGVGIVLWFVLAGLIGAVVDREIARGVLDPGVPVEVVDGRAVVWRMLAVRALLAVPLGAVVAWAVARLVAAAYQELTVPTDIVRPLVERTLLTAGDAVVVVVVAWLLAETIGGIAVRRLVLVPRLPDGAEAPGGPAGRSGALRALRDAVVLLVRSPVGALLTLALGLAGLAVVVVPGLLITSTAWDLVASAVRVPPGANVDLAAFAITWDAVVLASSWLILVAGAAIGAAWRSALWSAEVARRAGPDGPIEGLDKDEAEGANRTRAAMRGSGQAVPGPGA